jgi:hypothetical protein
VTDAAFELLWAGRRLAEPVVDNARRPASLALCLRPREMEVATAVAPNALLEVSRLDVGVPVRRQSLEVALEDEDLGQPAPT